MLTNFGPAPLVVAGVGIGIGFPTVANAVTGSVPAEGVGLAVGTNNALNALGGVFGIAILAAVFAAHGSSFITGFRPAEWIAAAAAAVGVAAALLAPSGVTGSGVTESGLSASGVSDRAGPRR